MEERAGCFALFVFLVSRDCQVALLHGLQFLIVVFPDNTHLILLLNESVEKTFLEIITKEMFKRSTYIVSTYNV